MFSCKGLNGRGLKDNDLFVRVKHVSFKFVSNSKPKGVQIVAVHFDEFSNLFLFVPRLFLLYTKPFCSSSFP